MDDRNNPLCASLGASSIALLSRLAAPVLAGKAVNFVGDMTLMKVIFQDQGAKAQAGVE